MIFFYENNNLLIGRNLSLNITKEKFCLISQKTGNRLKLDIYYMRTSMKTILQYMKSYLQLVIYFSNI